MVDTRTARGAPRKRTPREVENDEFAAFVGRVIRAHTKRIGQGDIEALADLASICLAVEVELHKAVGHLRSAEGGAYSWADIGRVLGITRQAAQQRFADAGGARYPGGQPGYLR